MRLFSPSSKYLQESLIDFCLVTTEIESTSMLAYYFTGIAGIENITDKTATVVVSI